MYSMSVGACCVAAEAAVIHDIIASYVSGGYCSRRFSIFLGVYFKAQFCFWHLKRHVYGSLLYQLDFKINPRYQQVLRKLILDICTVG